MSTIYSVRRHFCHFNEYFLLKWATRSHYIYRVILKFPHHRNLATFAESSIKSYTIQNHTKSFCSKNFFLRPMQALRLSDQYNQQVQNGWKMLHNGSPIKEMFQKEVFGTKAFSVFLSQLCPKYTTHKSCTHSMVRKIQNEARFKMAAEAQICSQAKQQSMFFT